MTSFVHDPGNDISRRPRDPSSKEEPPQGKPVPRPAHTLPSGCTPAQLKELYARPPGTPLPPGCDAEL